MVDVVLSLLEAGQGRTPLRGVRRRECDGRKPHVLPSRWSTYGSMRLKSIRCIALQRHLNIDTRSFSWYLCLSTHNRTRRQQMLPACRTADEPFAIPQVELTRSD